MRYKTLRLAFVALAVALLASACTIYVRPGGFVSDDISLSGVIQDFRPTRGAGSSYYPGENVEFRIVTTQSGYVTLTALDPDGRIYVFERNIPVSAGATYLPLAGARHVYTVNPPRGLQRVRASFTSTATDGNVRYVGRYGDGEWSSAISLEIRPSPVRDVAETDFYIR
ncbi:MAG: DUF4384 domain-containing protein [Trueperaceae bacterium]|nr:DUF4384 domain-containing protein [Trueperaceae bacterium]MCC6311553.1 DUF4384 domain-containing protein [Trueperaceae bacterium]MCO5174396.1 DUF4384 domain-containing protein [Trueperaceae bacterium]MCW5819083.1 DUF4384 domain-containing protein [Trueperaceae bacterium]